MRRLAVLAAFLLIAPSALASTGAPALDFADHIRAVEPAFAALEYERFLDRFPGHPEAAGARERLAELYLAQGELLKAQRHFRVLEAETAPPDQARFALRLAYVNERKGWLDQARSDYERLADDPAVRTSAIKHLLWLEIRQRRWPQAQAAAERLASDPRVRALRDALVAWQARPRPSVEEAQRRSTWFPGAGQVYAGDWGSALTSFTLNAAWIGLLSYAVAERDWVGGLIVANFGPRYYLGGIQTAGERVAAQLKQEDQGFIQQLEATYPQLLPANE